MYWKCGVIPKGLILREVWNDWEW